MSESVKKPLRALPLPRNAIIPISIPIVLTCLLALSTCSPHPPQLHWVRQQGVLRVATTNSPTTCYRGAHGPAGYECELLTHLANWLGVRLQLLYVGNAPEAIAALLNHRVDLAAAGIDVGGIEAPNLRYSLPIQNVSQQLVYRMGQPRPRNYAHLTGHLEVVEGSAGADALTGKSALHPRLQWHTTRVLGSEDLLYKVSQGQLDYTVASSDLIAINRRYYPNLRVAFDVSRARPVAWAMRRSEDDSLYEAVEGFLSALGPAQLAHLRHAYFTSSNSLDYLGVVRFRSDYAALLPEYRALFQAAAAKNGLDWRLLAAIGYQESRWSPNAVSPTGVHGLMMLTMDTASLVNVANRENAAQSIRGGATYLSQLLDAIPDGVHEPDRTWMALAAWNMGLGHLLDARRLTRERGGNPNLWKDVRETLPLLMREEWFDRTTYGYARGEEAQKFVDNVRSYYDLMVWFTGGQSALVSAGEARIHATSEVKSSAAPPAPPATDESR